MTAMAPVCLCVVCFLYTIIIVKEPAQFLQVIVVLTH